MARTDDDEVDVTEDLTNSRLTKREREQFRRRAARAAALLPSLPDTATELAQKLHERAQNMLKIRVELIEDTVNQMFDQTLHAMVREACDYQLRSYVAKVIQKIVEEKAPALVEKILGPAMTELKTTEWREKECRNRLDEAVKTRFDGAIKELAETEAENLAKETMKEVKRYYGAAKLLAEEGDSSSDN